MVNVGDVPLSQQSWSCGELGPGEEDYGVFPLDLARVSRLSHQSEEIRFDNC